MQKSSGPVISFKRKKIPNQKLQFWSSSSSHITAWFIGWFWCAQARFLLEVTKSMFLNQEITQSDRFRPCSAWECLAQGIIMSFLKQRCESPCCVGVVLQHCLIQATGVPLVHTDLTNSDIARGSAPSIRTKSGVWLCHKLSTGEVSSIWCSWREEMLKGEKRGIRYLNGTVHRRAE